MRLIHEPTGKELKVGDAAYTFRNEDVTIKDFNERRVWCVNSKGQTMEWYHSVIRCYVVE